MRRIFFGSHVEWLAWVLGATVVVLAVIRSDARDLGQWQDDDLSHWYASLMQPDNPSISCCGEADAYWADGIEVVGDKVFAIITDDRPDEPLRRLHIPVGTKIEIPPHKLKFDRGNPTGHAIVFMSATRQVYCFVQNTGI